MEEYIKVSARTVEDALLEASIELGTTSDNIEYLVVERETKGFLGLGAKKAVIEARKKKSDEDIINEVFNGKKEEKKQPKKQEKKAEKAEKADKADKDAKTAKKPEKKVAKEEKAEKPDNAEEKKPVKAGQTEKAENAAEEKKAEKKPEKKAEKKSEEKERAPRVPADPQVATERAVSFLQNMFGAMDLSVDIDTTFEDDTLTIDLSGDDMGILIGKRGQTLDSVQYLTSLVVNKGKASYVRVKVDTENYRERRKATLENLAKNIAFKVKKTRRPVYLEPMNPYERRIIHSALQNDPYVTTHSEGEEPLRKVVVTLKKRDAAAEEE